MKKTILILSLATFTGLTAQTKPIQVEVTDRTEITLLAAQYDVLQQQKREAQAQENLEAANVNFNNFNNDLNECRNRTSDPDLLKRIIKAKKQNGKLLNLYNSNRYANEFYNLEAELSLIIAEIKKLTP